MVNLKSFESFDDLSDNELIIKYKEGNTQALDALALRYCKVIFTKAALFKKYKSYYDDFVQEGFIAFLKAVKTFDASKGNFKSYAGSCIHNRMLNYMRHLNTGKNNVLTKSISIFELQLISQSVCPEEAVDNKERIKDINEKIKLSLSPFEQKVLLLHLSNKKYADISLILNAPLKSVDNALQRVRRKLRTALD